ncbi:MAG TPA: hypothetical protein VK909_16810 [Anaerolineales bacterium]|jgi:hypothetical protein|nr:hypothetical protein [Anaerolineales bacterium]
MKPMPDPENAPVLRTDFSDPAAWDEIRAEIQKPVGILQFRAYVEFIDDPAYADLTTKQLLELLPPDYNHSFIIVADRATISNPEHPLLVIDLFDKPTREFRALPQQIQGIENNLSIANMDFEEFADAVHEDGVFRGFPEE